MQITRIVLGLVTCYLASTPSFCLSQSPNISGGSVVCNGGKPKKGSESDVAERLQSPTSFPKGRSDLASFVNLIDLQCKVTLRLEEKFVGDVKDFLKRPLQFPVDVRGLRGEVVIGLICEQLNCALWIDQDKAYLVSEGENLKQLIEEFLLAEKPVSPKLLRWYANEVRSAQKH